MPRRTMMDEHNARRAAEGLPPLPPPKPRRPQKNPRGLKIVPPLAAPSVSEAPPKSSSQPLRIEAPSEFTAPPKTEGARGFLKVTNELVDGILPTLRPSEQAVLLRLYRLSRGFNAATCTVSIGVLANRCHLKPSQTRLCIKELVRRGFIRRLGIDLANPVQDLRGVTFEMLVDGAAPSNSGAPSKTEAIKENASKELIKLCARCEALNGFYYPDPSSPSKGMKRCDHRPV